MLRITVYGDETKRRIELAGRIAGPWVDELEKAWRSAASSAREIEIDLRDVIGMDVAGRELLQRFCAAGVRFNACGVAMIALIDEIHGKAPSDPCGDSGKTGFEQREPAMPPESPAASPKG